MKQKNGNVVFSLVEIFLIVNVLIMGARIIYECGKSSEY